MKVGDRVELQGEPWVVVRADNRDSIVLQRDWPESPMIRVPATDVTTVDSIDLDWDRYALREF